MGACGGNHTEETGSFESETSQAAALAAACSGCHSDQSSAIASLENYSENMLLEAFTRYKSEAEGTTVMHRLARGYSDADITAVSAYLGREAVSE